MKERKTHTQSSRVMVSFGPEVRRRRVGDRKSPQQHLRRPRKEGFHRHSRPSEVNRSWPRKGSLTEVTSVSVTYPMFAGQGNGVHYRWGDLNAGLRGWIPTPVQSRKGLWGREGLGKGTGLDERRERMFEGDSHEGVVSCSWFGDRVQDKDRLDFIWKSRYYSNPPKDFSSDRRSIFFSRWMIPQNVCARLVWPILNVRHRRVAVTRRYEGWSDAHVDEGYNSVVLLCV